MILSTAESRGRKDKGKEMESPGRAGVVHGPDSTLSHLVSQQIDIRKRIVPLGNF